MMASQGLQEAGFLAAGADELAVRKVGIFLVAYFKDQYAGRATQDIGEQIGAELQGLLDQGYISFPSAFTFVGRAFTSVDGIARNLQPETYDFGRACEPYVGRLISEEYSSQARTQIDEVLAKARSWLGMPD